MSPLVSVIIPTFNRREWVVRAVDSVLAQTFTDIEVIVVDDGSSDGTGDLVRQRFGSDQRVHYLRQANAERAVARNTGICAARGKYVAFLDSDDQWLPHKLARQVPLLESHPDLAFVFSGFAWIDEADERIKEVLSECRDGKTQGDIFEELLISNVVGSLTVVARRSALDEAGMFNTDRRLIPFAEDWELWLRLAYRRQVGYVAEPLALHRVHGGNTAEVVNASTYKVMVRKILGYVKVGDRACVKSRAERYHWGLIDDALWKHDRKTAARLWLHGALFFGPRFVLHGLKYRGSRRQRSAGRSQKSVDDTIR